MQEYVIIHYLGTRIYAMLLRPTDTKSHIKGLRPYAGFLNKCFPVNLCLIVKHMKLILILKTCTILYGFYEFLRMTICKLKNLSNLLTHTLLFWHFLKHLNFEFKNILEYIRTMFSGNAWFISETTDAELLKYGSLS